MTDEVFDTPFGRDLRSMLAAQAPDKVPQSLRTFVAAVPSRDTGIRVRHPRLTGFALLASAAVIAVVAVGVLLVVFQRPPTNPVSAPTFGAGPSPSALRESGTLQFTIDSGDQVPTSAQLQNLKDALFARLAVYVPTAKPNDVSVATDGSEVVTVTVDRGTPNADSLPWLLLVLRSPGNVEFVPIGSDALPNGATTPPSAHALFAGTAVTSVTLQLNQFGQPELGLQLDADAARVFTTWATSDVGSALAITVDGQIFLTQIVQAPLPDGSMSISGAGSSGDRARMLEALLKSGPLPYGLIPVLPQTTPSISLSTFTSEPAALTSALGPVEFAPTN